MLEDLIGSNATIQISGEQGVVKGVALYANSTEPQLYIHYKAADGRAVDQWFNESELSVTEK